MRSSKNLFVVLLIVVLFVASGCNPGNQGTSGTEKETDGNASPAGNAKSPAGETETSETTIPDIDFPEGDEANDDAEKADENKSTVVKFGKGKTSRGYKNAVIRAENHTYLLSAANGQTMSVSITSLDDNAVFRIRTPSGKPLVEATTKEGTKNFNGPLPSSGTYKIVVTPTRGNATFDINFAVTGKAASGKDDNSATIESLGGLTTVVKFKKGGTSATYENGVIRGERNKYILGASAGQVMTVKITSLENNAVFDIQAPNGKTLVTEVRDWSGQLPTDGKYRIIVGGTRGNASYTVRFAVR